VCVCGGGGGRISAVRYNRYQRGCRALLAALALALARGSCIAITVGIHVLARKQIQAAAQRKLADRT
jgi:hypothetical protein